MKSIWYVIGLVVVIALGALCFGVIWNSDLPMWLKFFLLR